MFPSLIGLLILALDIYVLYLILTRPAEVGMKILWTILVLILPVVGPILYFLVARQGKSTG